MSESTESNTIAGAQSNETTQYVNADMHYIQASYRLNGKNYLKWSQLVQTFLKGKGKLSHLLGTGPKKGDPSFDAWDEEDSMIMAWLWNSMTPEISDTCMFLSTATDIWVALKQTYSKAQDAAQVFEIKVKIGALFDKVLRLSQNMPIYCRICGRNSTTIGVLRQSAQTML